MSYICPLWHSHSALHPISGLYFLFLTSGMVPFTLQLLSCLWFLLCYMISWFHAWMVGQLRFVIYWCFLLQMEKSSCIFPFRQPCTLRFHCFILAQLSPNSPVLLMQHISLYILVLLLLTSKLHWYIIVKSSLHILASGFNLKFGSHW